jgi:uncharacterized protein
VSRHAIAFVTLLSLLWITPAQAGKLILIIDDIGNNHELGERAVNLPGQVNLAFLPHTPWAEKLANQGWKNGHTVMLHAPMANTGDARLGPGALTEGMSRQNLQQTLLDDIRAIPHVEGVNNHMGSQLTREVEAMTWVMEVLDQQGLFFVDSRTTAASVALKQARQAGIPAMSRDIFLDNDRSEAAIRQQFEQALQLASHHGQAVVIGHPYPETLDFLERELPGLTNRGIWLAGLGQLLPNLPPKPQPAIQAPLEPLRTRHQAGDYAETAYVSAYESEDARGRSTDKPLRPQNQYVEVSSMGNISGTGIPVANLPMSTRSIAGVAIRVSTAGEQTHRQNDYPMQALPFQAEIIRQPDRELACPSGADLTPVPHWRLLNHSGNAVNRQQNP